jgi:prevent-host-death family protein
VDALSSLLLRLLQRSEAVVDRTIPHRELRNNSSAVLRDVQSGTTFRVTNHGKVVAILTSPSTGLNPALKVRHATIRGGFDQLEQVEIDTPTQQILDELRGER